MPKRVSKKKTLPDGYDSWLEVTVKKSAKHLKRCNETINYIIEKVYEPDFKYNNIYVEVKGYFATPQQASKYIWIRKHLPKGSELVFVFDNLKQPFPRSKKRKDGSRFSVGDWAKRNKFTYYTKFNMPTEWRR